MYWAVNGDGWCTETEWNIHEKRNSLEKLKIHTHFQLENLNERGTLCVVGLENC